MSAVSLTVRHRFEAAHRLPQLGGRCTNLHGHSWVAQFTVTGPMHTDGAIIDFGGVKTVLGNWIDAHLDHAVLLGAADPLTPGLIDAGCAVFGFGDRPLTEDLPWPTVEAVAVLLSRVAEQILATFTDRRVTVTAVTVTETARNSATWHR